jgi:hypothetical protein
MRYPYDAAYEPPFPAASVVLHNSEEGLRTETVPALLDTGNVLNKLCLLLDGPAGQTDIRS